MCMLYIVFDIEQLLYILIKSDELSSILLNTVAASFGV